MKNPNFMVLFTYPISLRYAIPTSRQLTQVGLVRGTLYATTNSVEHS